MAHDRFWSPVLLSLEVSLAASLIAFLLALAAAQFMARHTFHGKLLVETLLMLPLVLPPTVVGFGLLVVLGRSSWLGRLIEWVFHQPVVFTWWAAVIAAAVVAFPLVYQTLKTGFESVDPDLENAARTDGAGEWQVFRYVTMPLAWRSLLSGFLFGFARSIGEFGATLMFAGNIPGKTETIPTAIYLAVESGDMERAASWVITIVALSYLMLGLVHILRSRTP